MATHSSVLAWRIPGTGEPGGLPSMGLHRVGHDWSDLAAAAAANRNSSTLATSCEELTHWKRLWCWKGLGAGRKGDDRGWGGWMASLVGWHHRLDGHEFEWTPGVGDAQGGLACCNSLSRKESDMTERLNWTELNWNSEVALSGPTLCDPMDHSLLGSSIHEIFQARVLEWVAISFSRRSFWPGDQTQVSHRCLTIWATREAPFRKETIFSSMIILDSLVKC